MAVVMILSVIIIGCLLVIELCKDAPSKNIPASYWNNQKLYTEDILNGVSHEQRMKNLRNGKYYLPDTPWEEPPRDSRRHVIVEDSERFEYDKKTYGYAQAVEWARQGKYNKR